MAGQREIAELIISLRGEVADVKKQFNEATGELTKFSKKHTGIFTTLKKNWLLYTAGITGVIYSLKRVSESFLKFEHKMREVNTLTNLSEKAFKRLQSTVLNITRRVPQSAHELADALYDIVSAGVDVADSNYVLEQSAKAAIAGVTNTKTAVNAGLSVINAYGKSIDELGGVYDILFQTVKQGVVTFEQLAASVGTVLPVAAAVDEDFEAIAASIAVLTKQGIQAQQATTFLRSGILALTAPTEQAKEALNKMGIEWKGLIPTLKSIAELGLDIQGLRQIIPDIRAGQAIIALTNNIEELEKVMEGVGDASDSMQTAYDIMMQSPENQIRLLTNGINYLKIALVQTFSPGIISLIKAVNNELNDIITIRRRLNVEQRQLSININYYAETIAILRARRVELEKTRDTLKAQGKDVTDLNEKIDRYNKAIIRMAKLSSDEFNKNFAGSLLNANNNEPPIPETPIPENVIDEEKTKVAVTSLKLFNEQIKSAFADLDYAYKQGEISAEEYYNARRQLAEIVYNTEIDALNDLYTRTEDETKQREIREQILAREVEHERELTQLKREEKQANKELADSQKQVNKLLEGIEYRVRLESATEYQRDLMELQRRQEEERLEIIKNSNNVERDLKRAEIAWQKEQTRLLVEYEAQKAQELLTSIQNAITGTITLFSTLYDLKVQKVQNTQQAIEKAEKAGNKNKAALLRKQLEEERASAKKAFNIMQAASLAEAWINYYTAITKCYAQGGVYGALNAIGVSATLISQIAKIASQTPKYYSGGEVEGQSGIDKVPARLTKGEFVQPTSSVDYYGTDAMEAIRRRAIPKSLFSGYQGMVPRISSGRFAEGGMQAATTTKENSTLQITNIVDPNIFGQYLSQKPGEAMVINIIGSNAYEIRRRLGL